MIGNWKWKLAQSLEIKWWKNYLDNKDIQTYLKWKQQYWKDFITKITNIPTLENLTILDAGCGPAGIFTVLENNKVYALDPLLDEYKKLAHFDPVWYPYTQFITQSIEQIETKEEYDVIFCLNAINHVENIELAYKKLAEALKPNGWLIVSIDAHRNAFLHKLFKILPGDVLHPHQYNLKEYEGFMAQNKINLLPSILIKKEFIFDYYVTYGKK